MPSTFNNVEGPDLAAFLVAALGLVLASWALSAGLRLAWRLVLAALLLVAGFAVVRLSLPEAFCAARWPPPIAALCSK
jgi:hypothetical protein